MYQFIEPFGAILARRLTDPSRHSALQGVALAATGEIGENETFNIIQMRPRRSGNMKLSAINSFDSTLNFPTRVYEQEAGKPEGFPPLGCTCNAE